MKKIKITNYLIPIYLAIIILIQINLTISNTIIVIIPILIISISIYLKNKQIGILGIFLFYTLSIYQISINTIESYYEIIFQILFLVLPSILLIGQILQIESLEKIIFKPQLKPLVLSFALFSIIIIITYVVCTLLWDGFLISAENLEGQIFVLAAVSIICCLPFLVIQKVKNKMA